MSSSRRSFLGAATAAAVGRLGAVPHSGLGIATTSYMTFARPRDPLVFLEHVHALGAAGIQADLSPLEPADVKRLRARAEEYGMYIEAMVPLPGEDSAGCERAIVSAREAGAVCVRAGALGGRRYEDFSSLADWQDFVARSKKAIDRALPILDKHRMPMGLENHKDWTVEEMLALLREKSSPWLGVCLDTGNNLSLLDSPMEVVEKLAPYTICTHLKDVGAEPYRDGFRLAEMPLGEGMLDLKRVVATITNAKPRARMTLEMITRDPLEIPCLTDKYWATFPHRNGAYLASTLRLVRDRHGRQALPRVAGLPRPAQLRLEEDNVRQSLHYAREQLGL
jgi:sugar phosphate isomerase/epimerase